MMPGGEQANIIGLRSKEFVSWVDGNLRKPLESGPGKWVMDNVVDKFLNWAKRNSTWPLHFGIMCCAIEMAATSAPRSDGGRLGVPPPPPGRRPAPERPDFPEAPPRGAPPVRADGGAEVGHRDGRVHDLRRPVLRLVLHREGLLHLRADGHLPPRLSRG